MAKVTAEVGSTTNRYQILAKLAVGGMAEIFLVRGASGAGVERYCVLKRILHDRASDAQLIRMFLNEARLAAQLQHPNIASVYDIGMLGNAYFFTMEYVHGETVRNLMLRAQELERAVPLPCILTIIAGAASGLHHAHERNTNDGRPLGIVHRDVSPSNLMVSFEGNVKVVDFGVAKAADRGAETLAGTVKGKIGYLSPEQCRGAAVDRRSDLFSLGIVMWEMLTGARLYRRDSEFENMTAIVHEPAPPPSTLRPDVPPAVDDIVVRLLAKSADDRFQSAAAVVEAIEDAAMRGGIQLSTSAVGRLVHELFGTRAEPWLAVTTDPHQHESSTVKLQSVSPDPAATDTIEALSVRAPGASRRIAELPATSMSSDSIVMPQIERHTEVEVLADLLLSGPTAPPVPETTPLPSRVAWWLAAVSAVASALVVIAFMRCVQTSPDPSPAAGSRHLAADLVPVDAADRANAPVVAPAHNAAEQSAVDAPAVLRDQPPATLLDAPLPPPTGEPRRPHAATDAGVPQPRPIDAAQAVPTGSALEAPVPPAAETTTMPAPLDCAANPLDCR